MSAYVVTPSGELLIYSTANYVKRGSEVNGAHSLYEAKDGTWVADVPVSWAVSFARPTASVVDRGTFADIKRALRNFDMRTGRFKE